jgi:hypothetical protein
MVPSANSAGEREKSVLNDDAGFAIVPPSPCSASPRSTAARVAHPFFVGMSMFSSIGTKPV